MNNRIRRIVIAGTFSALVIVLGATGLGFIPLPLGAITILQVPVIIGALIEGPAVGFCTGFFFGLFSIVQAAIAGSSPVDLAFLHYPVLAIVPRVLIGPGAWLVYALVSGNFFRRAQDGKSGGETENVPGVARETAAIAAGAVTGSLINTVLVLGGLAFLLPGVITWRMAAALAALNGSVEAGCSAVISLAVALPWKGFSRRKKSKLNS
jgi:uncharacterized membrane protein